MSDLRAYSLIRTLRGSEKAACGVGFVATTMLEPRNEYLKQGLNGLCKVEHRGGNQADRLTSDGSGIMTDIPFEMLGYEAGSVAVATLLLRLPADHRKAVLETFERVLSDSGMPVLEFREVPVDTSVLGRMARATLPSIGQVVIKRPPFCRTERSFQTRLYYAHQTYLTLLRRMGLSNGVVTSSMSTRTIVYKALVTSERLEDFYPDLKDSRFKTRFSLFHRRFSTNTATNWDKAQPFRLVAHNGEINTIACNRANSHSREQALGLPPGELMTHVGISDSGSLNEMVEALRFRSSIPHLSEALAIMMPPAGRKESGFYEFWSRAVEPWDGPAFVAFSDGEVVGARLDRNGFRPGRWALTKDAFYLASEAGVFGLDEAQILSKGALRGGSGAHVVLETGEVRFNDPSESLENAGAHFDPRLHPVGSLSVADQRHHADEQALFGYTKEEMSEVLVPMMVTGKEPIGSMGDTARPAILSDQPRSFFDYFYQTFAQVTNPPVDHLRERAMTDLRTTLGRKPNVFEPKTLIPPLPAIALQSPILTLEEMAWVRQAAEKDAEGDRNFESVEVSATFAKVRGARGLEEALEDLSEKVLAAIRGGCSIVILTDRLAKPSRPPIPSLLALRAAITVLDAWGLRLEASIVIDTADARTTHHMAALVGFGASAVCPYRAFELAQTHNSIHLRDIDIETRRDNLRKAFEEGLRKVMSKMGISTVLGYQDSRLFTAIGLGSEVISKYFDGTPSPVAGLSLGGIGEQILQRVDAYESGQRDLLDTFQLREHRKGTEGEQHAMTARLSKRVHDFIDLPHDGFPRWTAYEQYIREADSSKPVSLRHLFELKESPKHPSLEDVQPRAEILRRFGSGAMSFGAISAESQRDLFIAMRRVGGRSGSGEGGENPFYWSHGIHATSRQVASGRFGVSARFLISGQELEIKIAQGAKPGEGGQLMSMKVDESIAKARNCLPGTTLISPPPLHDIYSIEDLRELIYELKQLKPNTPVSVKLVAGANIGTIAAGVVKAGADIVQISGGDGGTGAASLSSMKHAGLPWELGLAEVHQTLIEQELRENAILRVDGGLQTGFDIVVAAMLGAEQFGFGKILLIAEGCIMARICQKNTCPRGIATHDPRFKKKYRGTPEMVETFLHYLAEDVRRQLMRVGATHLDEVVGRAEFLEVAEKYRDKVESRGLDLGLLRSSRPHPRGFRGNLLQEDISSLNRRIVDDSLSALDSGMPVELEYPIRSHERAVLSTLAGEIASRQHDAHMEAFRSESASVARLVPEGENRGAGLSFGLIRLRFVGSAGQGFGAFVGEGIDATLIGEANDSVAKSLSGGRIIVRPHPSVSFAPGENAIIGNAALYGATGGTLFVQGMAGDRFAVRNSGALAVVEGTGLHACEYMTGGTVVILGAVSSNVGAGMTGGQLFLGRSQALYVNRESLEMHDLGPEDRTRLLEVLSSYVEATDSDATRKWLDPQKLDTFVVWRPKVKQRPLRAVSG
ncbi:MAG: glutamate synthase large subunit [Myxococcales bacterium]|nr:glutamate synthase large subunit [Myxococcales bacterium]